MAVSPRQFRNHEEPVGLLWFAVSVAGELRIQQ